MQIFTGTTARPLELGRQLVVHDAHGQSATLAVRTGAPLKSAPVQAAGGIEEVSLNRLLLGAAAAKGAAGSAHLLVSQLQDITPDQISTLFMDHGAPDARTADHWARKLCDGIDSQVSGAVLFGFQAGILVYTFVSVTAPRWSLAVRAGLALIVAVAVAAFLYFVVGQETPKTTPPPPSQVEQAVPAGAKTAE